jgi:hypothetical protein
LANNETAPATSNRANKIFAFMGVLKIQEQDVCLVAMRPTPFKRTCDQSYWQQSSKLADGVNWANWIRDMSIAHAASPMPSPTAKAGFIGLFSGPIHIAVVTNRIIAMTAGWKRRQIGTQPRTCPVVSIGP